MGDFYAVLTILLFLMAVVLFFIGLFQEDGIPLFIAIMLFLSSWYCANKAIYEIRGDNDIHCINGDTVKCREAVLDTNDDYHKKYLLIKYKEKTGKELTFGMD